MSFLINHRYRSFLTSAGVFGVAVSLDEPSFDSSTVLVVEVLLLGGGCFLMCADFPAAIARTVLNLIEPQPISKES